ncbi:hypothetical protein QFC20_004559 [Naganishia adeliensis]|uniref:Uncharacterized protein n=1 Tax=Naganishia adeliensis TaxID=92952 RepID=A0ACC2VZJ3_9TREE|nr:hypothetical protein QFC20_004559 [Naganishia adeliensis]
MRVLYWFRTDLRLHDSPALTAALDLGTPSSPLEAFYPVWCFDPQYVWKHKVGVNRWQFLLESMRDLSDSLHRLNEKQRLHVLRGAPEEVLPLVWRDWGITHMVFEKRDEQILSIAKQHAPEIKIIIKDGHNLLDPELVVKKGNNGKCISTLVAWKKAAAKVGEVPKPLPPIQSLPDPGTLDLPSATDRTSDASMDGPYAHLQGENVNHDIMNSERFNCFSSISGPDHDFAVPTLSSLGLGEATTSIHGGETEALRRLAAFLADKTRTATFSKPASAPTSLQPSTTQLSPYLKFGCLSVREFYWRAREVIEGYVPRKGEKVTKEPENLIGQLEFREMYYCAEFATPKYDRIRGNPLSKYALPPLGDNADTGSRFMNWALMNKYDEKGEMVMPRPRGKEVDEERFLEMGMLSLRFERTQAENRTVAARKKARLDSPGSTPLCDNKTDKTGALVRKYCPELSGFPDKYIYEPHLAPIAIQEKAKCIIGKDYPFPMLDEKREKERCIARLKVAYGVGLHGNAPEVLDGRAEGILKEKFKQAMGKEEEDEGNGGINSQVGGKRQMTSGPMDAFVKKAKRS